MFDINNFVIDRIKRGIMTNTADGSVMYSINQIQNPSLSCTADEVTAVDAIGTTVMTFNRAKSAQLSAENALFDLSLLATQMGADKKVATTSAKVVAPMFETIDLTATVITAGSVVLQKTPKVAITEIYELKGDSTFGTKYLAGSSATANEFVYVADSHTITLPTGMAAGSQIFVMYEYETDAAVEVVNNATEFPKAGKFVMEVLGCDVCDPTTLIHAYVIFPNAKLDANVDISFATDATHPFTMKAQQAYCDKEKVLFKIIVPDMN